MDFLHRMFGSGAHSASSWTSSQATFVALREKYRPALEHVESSEEVQLEELYVDGRTLVLRGTAATETARQDVVRWFEMIDANRADVRIELEVGERRELRTHSYTTRRGDTLYSIAERFYGDPNEYMRIVYANRARLRSPERLPEGMVLLIPESPVTA